MAKKIQFFGTVAIRVWGYSSKIWKGSLFVLLFFIKFVMSIIALLAKTALLRAKFFKKIIGCSICPNKIKGMN
jgi:hypothetical protein